MVEVTEVLEGDQSEGAFLTQVLLDGNHSKVSSGQVNALSILILSCKV